MANMPSLNEVKAFFFKGMVLGWAGGGKYKPASGIPGYKVFDYELGDFRLFDFYTNPNNYKSSGWTAICFNDTVVWTMGYQGKYEEQAIPVVKHALLAAYANELFLGGRGPENFEENGLLYLNHCDGRQNDPAYFNGMEQVLGGNSLLGYHQYWGMSHL